VATCKPVGVDLDAVIAIQVSLPDSGIVEEGDTIVPHALALNGYGDSVAAEVAWTADTATLQLLDSATGATVGRRPPSGRLQARVGSLRSPLLTVTVRPQADTLSATGVLRRLVVAPDSQSDGLEVRLEDLTTGTTAAGLANRPVAFTLTYPAGGGAFTLLPGDTVLTGSGGLASVQVRLVNRALPDSAVVEVRAVRANGQVVPGSPVTFVVEFQP